MPLLVTDRVITGDAPHTDPIQKTINSSRKGSIKQNQKWKKKGNRYKSIEDSLSNLYDSIHVERNNNTKNIFHNKIQGSSHNH